MAKGLHKLLNYIVENPLMRIESKEVLLEASAMQDVEQEIVAISEDRRGDADRLADSFAEGIRRASQSGGKIVVDDTDPTGNSIADAFARFLVTVNLATSQSEELGNNHYRYTFELDWPRLNTLAQRAGVDLDAAVRET